MEYFACVLVTTIVWGALASLAGDDMGAFMLLVGCFMAIVYLAMYAGAVYL